MSWIHWLDGLLAPAMWVATLAAILATLVLSEIRTRVRLRQLREQMQEERKGVDKTLEMLEACFMAMPDQAILLDRQFNILRSNRAHAQSATDPTLCSVCALWKNSENENCAVEQAFITGQPQVYESVASSNGEILEVRTFPIFITPFEPLWVLAFVRNISELRRTQQALRRSEERLRIAMSTNNEGLWDWDIKSNRVYYDPGFFNMLGYGKNEWFPSIAAWRQLIHPEDQSIYQNAIQKALDTRTLFRSTYRMRGKDGSYRWMRASGAIVERDSEDAPQRMIGTHIDITSERQIQETLEEALEKQRIQHHELTMQNKSLHDSQEALCRAQARYQQLFENAPQAYILLDRNLRVLEANEEARRMLFDGQQAQVHTRKKIPFELNRDLYHHWRNTLTSMRGESHVLEESNLILAGGECYIVRVESRLLGNHEGKEACFCTLTDLTKRILAERRLAHASSILHYHIENSPLPILEWDSDLVIQNWNRAAEDLLGHSAEAVVKQHMFDLRLIHTEDRAGVESSLRRHFAEGDAKSQQTCRILGHGGEVHYCELFHSLMFDENGGIVSVLTTIKDETERILAERDVRHMLRQLKQTNIDLKSFTSAASHDMQEPLRKITTFAEMLSKQMSEKLDDRERAYMDRLISAARRMRRLITDLLSYAQTTAEVDAHERVALEEVAQEAVGNLSQAIEEAQAVIHIGPLPTVLGNRTRLLQVFQNLIANALKFQAADTPPRVWVGQGMLRTPLTDRKEEHTSILFADNGIGIDLGMTEKIFKPFGRLHTRETFDGSGIGLAICQRIAEQHGGQIELASEEGVGSTFCLRLPAMGAPKQSSL